MLGFLLSFRAIENLVADDSDYGPLVPGTVLKFADIDQASAALANVDAFFESMSPFDRSARLMTREPVGLEEFQTFASSQARPWNVAERTSILEAARGVGTKLIPFHLPLPAEIVLVKTTGKEEGDAAYCRGRNVIVLPVRKLGGSRDQLENLLAHELFHILSRNHPGLRTSLYGAVGFKLCSPIELPARLSDRKITNPDAPGIEHYINVRINQNEHPVVPVLFSNTAQFEADSGKTFFDYLTLNLMVIERLDGNWRPSIRDGKPWLIEIKDAENFHEQVGRNTGYIIHPEEIIADNFVMMINDRRDVPNPEILRKIRQILTNP